MIMEIVWRECKRELSTWYELMKLSQTTMHVTYLVKMSTALFFKMYAR